MGNWVSFCVFHRPEVKKYYMELRNQNKSILGDFRVQVEAHDKFTSGLKSVSQLIDKAARLRGSVIWIFFQNKHSAMVFMHTFFVFSFSLQVKFVLIGLFLSRLIDFWYLHCSRNCSIDWLIEWLTYSNVYWLLVRLIDWLIDRLFNELIVDWSTCLFTFCCAFCIAWKIVFLRVFYE